MTKYKREIDEIREMMNTVKNTAYNDDMVEYSTIQPMYTGLNVDLFVDSGLAYKHNNHIPIVFVRDGYGKEENFMPISISQNPSLVTNNAPKIISREDLNSALIFIRSNYEGLLLLANDESSVSDFISNIKKYNQMVAEGIDELGQVKSSACQDKINKLPALITAQINVWTVS